jgi:zinc transporter
MNGTQDSQSTKTLPDYLAYVFDGNGAAHALDAGEDLPSDAFVWMHVSRASHDALSRLEKANLDRFVIEALTADETRPRCTVHGDGAIIILRGVNLDPGSEPEDMISVRLWIEEKRVIGVWVRPLQAVADLVEAIAGNRAPVSPGDFVARLAYRLADRAEPTVAALNERIDDLEDADLVAEADTTRRRLAEIRQSSISLRRYMFPQRDALTTLEIEDLAWLTDRDRSRIREAADRVTRLGEELDAIRDRAQVVRDQFMDLRAETMNRRMLVLSVVAAIFLPLGLLTGLLGINVSGIPGADNPWAFAIVCALLVAIGAMQFWIFRRMGIMR